VDPGASACPAPGVAVRGHRRAEVRPWRSAAWSVDVSGGEEGAMRTWMVRRCDSTLVDKEADMNLSSIPATPPAASVHVQRFEQRLDDASDRAAALGEIATRIEGGDPGAVRSVAGRLRALADVLADASDSASRMGARGGAEHISRLSHETRSVATMGTLPSGAEHMPIEQQMQLVAGLHHVVGGVGQLAEASTEALTQEHAPSSTPTPEQDAAMQAAMAAAELPQQPADAAAEYAQPPSNGEEAYAQQAADGGGVPAEFSPPAAEGAGAPPEWAA
jgi:hypothetical protein